MFSLVKKDGGTPCDLTGHSGPTKSMSEDRSQLNPKGEAEERVDNYSDEDDDNLSMPCSQSYQELTTVQQSWAS